MQIGLLASTMRSIWRILSLALFVLVVLFHTGMMRPPEPPSTDGQPDIEVFVREDCPHCTAAKVFLEKLKETQPDLRIVIQDVGRDRQALARLAGLAQQRGVRPMGVPAFFLREQLILGFASEETTGARIKALLSRPPPLSSKEPSKGICDLEATTPCAIQSQDHPGPVDRIDIPFLGRRPIPEFSLPLLTLFLGFVDGVNPCAMWVLLFLLSLLATLQDRKKMAFIAGIFVVMSGVVYFAFMAAWLNMFFIIGTSRVTQLVLAGAAILIGVVNVTDSVSRRGRYVFGIPQSMKPTLYAKMRAVIQAHYMREAVIGVVLLAALVNILELACTAGLPALYTEILSLHPLSWWEYYAYLGLYNLAYIADDAVMATIGVLTLSHKKLQVQEGRWLKLLSGVVMLGLGLLLLAAPMWLM